MTSKTMNSRSSFKASEVDSNNLPNKPKVLNSQNLKNEVEKLYEEQREIFVTESDDGDGFETTSVDGESSEKDLMIHLLDKRTSSKSNGREETNEVKKLKQKCYKIERELSFMTKEAKSLRDLADGALSERDELDQKLKSMLESENEDLDDGDLCVVNGEWDDDFGESDDSREESSKKYRTKKLMVYIAGVMVMVVCFITVSALCVVLL